MRILAFGCPHVQSRTTLGSSAFQPTVGWLVDTARQQQATHVVCLGDTVDSVSETDLMTNLTVKWVLDSFRTLAHSGVPVIWMLGNHDVYSEQYSALDIFDDSHNFMVLRQPKVVESEGVELVFWPFQQWMDRPVEWAQHTDMVIHRTSDRPRLLFTHVPIESIPIGGTKDQGADIKELGLEYDMVVAGHYHQANQFMVDSFSAQTPVVIPGCVVAHKFKDTGWFHGAVLYDTVTAQLSWLQNPHSHCFFTGTSQELSQALSDASIARMRDRMHVRLTDEVDAAPYVEYGLPTVQIRPKQKQIQSSAKQSFQLEGEPADDLQRWLQESGVQDVDRLVVLGKEYL